MKLTNGIVFGNNLTVWFEIIDVDQIGTLICFEVYKDGELYTSKEAPDNIFTDPNNDKKKTGDITFTLTESGSYKIVIVYKYDLNDGNNEHLIDASNDIVDHSIVVDK